MLVFYTWTVRLVAESVGHFSATEKLAYLANHVPQEGTSSLHVTQTGAEAVLLCVGTDLLAEAAETQALEGKPPKHKTPPTMSVAVTAVATGNGASGANASMGDSNHSIDNASATPPEEPTSPGGWSLGVVTEPLPEGPVGPLQGAPSLETMSYLNDSTGGQWPTSGTVRFDGAWMKYAPTAPYALRGVSFSIAHSEKVLVDTRLCVLVYTDTCLLVYLLTPVC